MVMCFGAFVFPNMRFLPKGTYVASQAIFTLTGLPTPGDLIELAWDPFGSFHYNYQIVDGDTLSSAVFNLAAIINQFERTSSATATASGPQITLTIQNATAGENSNRTGVYGTVSGAESESWLPQSQVFSGGMSPSAWTIRLPLRVTFRRRHWDRLFGELRQEDAVDVRSRSPTGQLLAD